MREKPVVIFGAGATKGCGGPLTAEILPKVFELRDKFYCESHLALLDQFLVGVFGLPHEADRRQADDYPSLPLLMSLIDTSIDRKQSFGPEWPIEQLTKLRRSLEYAIFAVIEYMLREARSEANETSTESNPYQELFGKICRRGYEPVVVSLNYDLFADAAMLSLCGEHSEGDRIPGRYLPDYGCDISSEEYLHTPDGELTRRYGRLLKLHGSLNWLFCPCCQQLDINIMWSGSGYDTWKGLDDFYRTPGRTCRGCPGNVQPILITPTFRKDYRNPHVASTWYYAERALRNSNHVYIIGYSLPDDDVDVIHLLKRGLGHLRPADITVVESKHDPRPLHEHPVGRRYRSLFRDVQWRPIGFGAWVQDEAFCD